MSAYVPTPVYVPHVSREAQELGQRIEQAIGEYRQTHPHLSQVEVEQALKIASGRAGGGRRVRMNLALVVGLTLLLVLGTIAFWLVQAG